MGGATQCSPESEMPRHIGLGLLLSTLTPGSLWAHAGHGVTEGDSLFHYVFEPVHFVPVVVLAAAIGVPLLIRYWKRNRR